MSKATPTYRKLPGRGAGFGEASRLFIADDHLLLVTATGFTENYRRFYLRDIQAITVRRTWVGLILNLVLAVPLAGCLLILTMGTIAISGRDIDSDDILALLVFGIPALLFAVLLIVNFLRGPTCACEIHTAVQWRRLGSVTRLRTARKVIDLLRPVLTTAQGAIPPDELRRRVDESRHYPTGDIAGAPPIIRSVNLQ